VNKKHIGIIAIIIASLMWAIEPIFAKQISNQGIDVFQTSAIRAIFAALTAMVYILFTKKSNLKVNKKQLSTIIYIAVAATLFADFMYFYALMQMQTPIVNAVIVGHMQPIFIILLAFLVLKNDRLTRFDYLGIFLMIIAGLLVTTKTFGNLTAFKFGTIGDLFVLSATIAWATTAIAMRKYLKELNAGVLTFYRFSIASLFFVIYLVLTSNLGISSVYQIFVGVVVGVGTIFYYEGLKRLKAAQVSGIELSTPLFAAVFAFFIFGESVTVMQIFGITLLFIGIYLLSKK